MSIERRSNPVNAAMIDLVDLEGQFRQMAADQEREAEALIWAEATIADALIEYGDVDDSTIVSGGS